MRVGCPECHDKSGGFGHRDISANGFDEPRQQGGKIDLVRPGHCLIKAELRRATMAKTARVIIRKTHGCAPFSLSRWDEEFALPRVIPAAELRQRKWPNNAGRTQFQSWRTK